MSHLCCNCDNLDTKKNKPGKVNGKLYYCKKLKTFVNTSKLKDCDNYKKAYKRTNWQTDEIYKDGKVYDNDDTPISLYIFLLIILIILGIIFGAFNQF